MLGLLAIVLLVWAPEAHAQKTFVDPDGTPHIAKLDDVQWKSTSTVHIALVSDSTVQDSSGWGPGFISRLKPNAEGLNLARGGRSTKSFRDEGRWAQALALKPDYLLIGFSHNDSNQKKPEAYVTAQEFKKNLERFVAEARAAGIKPILMTCETFRRWDGPAKLRYVDAVGAYEMQTRAVAKELGVPLLDVESITHGFFIAQGPEKMNADSAIKKDGSIDEIHVNQKGGMEIGVVVAEKAKTQVPELTPYIQ
jgi:pectinesterase